LISYNFFGQEKVNLAEASRKPTEVKLLNSNKQRNHLTFNLNAFYKKAVNTPRGKSFVIDIEEGSRILEKGNPDLPKLSESFIIPDAKKMKVEIVSSEYKEIKDIEIAPSKGNFTRDKDPEKIPYTYGKIYKRNGFYPKNLAELQNPYIVRDYRGQALWIYPVQYNPVEKILRIYTKIELKIIDTGKKGKNPFDRKKPLSKVNSQFDLLYQSHFINYETYSKYTPLDEEGSMLIISDATYMDAMQNFVDWKMQKGVPVEMVDVETIGRTASDIDTYIENYYNNNDLVFVLLVGDGGTSSGQIPSMYSNGDSDNAYGYITGDDHYPELFVGRFSAESVTDVETQVERVIHYERDLSSGASWLTNATGIGSSEGTGDDDEYDYEHIRNINTDLLGYNYDSADEFFDGSQGGDDASGDPTPSMLSDAFNEGRGIANYVGHGSSTYWVTSGFAISDVNSLANDNKLPFIIDVACVNGEFHGQTCFAESWLRATNTNTDMPTGAIAIIASTINQSWSPPMEGQDAMNDILTEQFSDNIKRTFGGITMNGCMQMNDEYGSDGDEMTDTWTIFGDPSLVVRTADPTEMTISHNSALLIGQGSFTVNCDQEDALVSLTYDGEILGTGKVNGGSVNISFDPLTTPGTMTVTVTAYNKVTYMQDVDVTPADQPYVVLDSTSLDDATGNGNGEADYGESLLLDSELKNVSDAYEAIGVFDSLYCTDPYITLSDSLEDYGDIAAEADTMIEGAFAFSVSDSIPDQHIANFSMHVTGEDASSNDYTWVSDFSITLNAPVLEIGDMTVDDASGNGDGILDPGETADLLIEVTNSGHADISNVNGTLSSSSSDLTIDSGSDGPISITEGSTQSLTFTVTADGSTPIGTPAEVDLDVTGASNDQYTDASTKQLVIGEIPEYLISQGGTVSTCVGLFYDSGGPTGEYSSSESYTMTFEPSGSGSVIKAEFLSFSVEDNYSGGCYDDLKIYDGSSTSADLIGTYCDGNPPGTVIATNAGGALTFEFDSDGSVTQSGWEAEISCVEMNEVTFTVSDGTNPVEDAEVTFAGTSIMTDGSGVASFVVENGTYNYTVSKTGYTEASGSLDVSSDISQNITLSVLTYDITFNLYEEDGSTPIEGDITFAGSTQGTTGGTYTFSDVEYGEGKSYSITVNNDYYADYSGTVDVTQDRTLDITMEPNLYDVNIGAKDTTGAMISGCNVTIDGTTHVTNGSGIATFALSQGSYTYDVTHPGYTSGNGSIEVDGLESSYSDTVELTIESYSITFDVYESDGVTALEASVTFDGDTQTATGGTCTFSGIVYSGVKSYEVTAEEHVSESGQIDLTSDMTKEIMMDSISYSVTVSVSDEESNALSGATVEMNGEENTTGSNGTVNYSLHKGNYTCRVNMSGYQEDVSDVMIDQDQTLDVTLLKHYDVTFTVLADSSDSAISGATVTVDGTDLTTGSNGEATTTLVSGTYDYTVTAGGYKDASGSINVTGNTGTNIRLEADISGIDMLGDQLRVYPNPADEELIIEFTGNGKMQYELLDMTGKTVQRGSLPQQTNKLDVSTHPSGIYFIRVRNDKQYVNYKLIIE